MTVEVGTSIWNSGFGCVTWVGPHIVGVTMLLCGEPKIVGFVPHSAAEHMAARWLELMAEDGRIETVV